MAPSLHDGNVGSYKSLQKTIENLEIMPKDSYMLFWNIA